ncbi:transporter substrate-binding domain-containing protein [Paracoccus denitrificans]|jgi:polar amino acid transport system substrate-binding protein|uniref:Amino acid ABC transporter substrate-binding protein, PAAT family n=1 Tax=Paracoccus denitrificans (strain Pd 1222) TaxID=318586 RepID=A1BBU3_PARDP|nr:transporter substrate-binding domain-containing protein [Paracoccus denitrificans]ABL72987.1 amino acid ABC transporter substrate-binding protein, PAAT family [Paracoccus denitrificans PD1222]MBB4628364.1 polar amino acid transport system substrate-binding protein [Paracoccus denitrificans]MCU7429576.1 transporter substrate-binding domain-containing protein [Paracoccus denitrificans]QAR29383.1 transporter substrate-binding domain-containing protein [Paracoccus denitrificans]UPV98289.1 trans
MTIRNLTLAALTAVGLAAALPAGADTLSDIRDRGTINIGVDIGQAPFGMVDGSMNQTGSDVDTARKLAEDLGVKLNVVSVAPANRIPFLLTGKVDVVVASFSITEERKKQVDFSKPYAVSEVVVATTGGLELSGPADLEGRQIAVTRASTNDTLITDAIAANDVKATIVRYDDNAMTTNAVLSGQHDVYVVAQSLLVPINEANPSRKIEPQFVLRTYPLAIGLRKNEPELKDWLDNWVDENLANGKLNEIYQTYHLSPLPDVIPEE